MTIGEKIKQARLAKGLTQEELADKLGYKSRSSVNKIETGGRDIPRSQIKKIADVLEVSPISLLGLEEDNDTKIEPNASIPPQYNVRMVPVYESVSAGFGAHAEDMVTGYMPLYIVSDSEAENTIVIKVQGDSMYPKNRKRRQHSGAETGLC